MGATQFKERSIGKTASEAYRTACEIAEMNMVIKKDIMVPSALHLDSEMKQKHMLKVSLMMFMLIYVIDLIL